MNTAWLKPFFIVAALYDGILGIAFLFFAAAIFQGFGVTPPNHYAYVQFPALLLILFAFMFLQVARDLAKYRHLILYGIGLKLSYSGLVFWYQLSSGVPTMWVPWAWADLIFLVLFVIAWRITMPARA